MSFQYPDYPATNILFPFHCFFKLLTLSTLMGEHHAKSFESIYAVTLIWFDHSPVVVNVMNKHSILSFGDM